MVDDLWADSSRASMLVGLGLGLEKSTIALEGANKVPSARDKVGPQQGGFQWSMVAHNGLCASGPS
ncbi:hypothetical protein CsSME_00008474 [Camellia sinensis var. sinensis]